jgi:hypothetical protein
MISTSLRSTFTICALMACTGAAPAATYVYMSNAEDGNIGNYWVQIVSFD